MGHHLLHLHRPLPSSSSLSPSSSETTTTTSTLTLGSGPTCSCGANEVYNHRIPQDFSLATAATNTAFYFSPTASKSPEMSAALGHPFTSAQWKELKRQAMIYKYMVASVPVPPDLLQPLTPNYNNKDPEPGRCKRTDGKKWRCSRDVAPNQKYCERHMNKGRSRSRKPVESHQTLNHHNSAAANKRNRLLPPSPPILPAVPPPQFLGSGPQRTEASLFLNKIDQNHTQNNLNSYKESNRGLEWGLRSEMPPMETTDQQWNHMLQRNMGFGNQNENNTVFNQGCDEGSLNLIQYTDYVEERPGSCNFFNQPQMEEPRDFINLWSNKNPNNDNNNNNSSVSLTLSMETASGDNDQIQMGLGIGESEKPQLAGWPSPVSWASSAPGGPLAEVLQSSVSSSYSSNAAQANASEMMMPFQWLT